MKASILVPLVFGIFTEISATPLTHGSNTNLCDGAVILASTWVGEGKNVEMKSVFCPNSYQHVLGQQAVPPVSPNPYQHVLEQQVAPVNVCGAPCATTCFTPSGGGPDPNDCHVIADALRFDSQSIGPLFTIPNKPNNTVVLKYNSCSTFFLNQSPAPEVLEYCRVDWASLIDFVAPNCQATQNAHGGLCAANDQSWFVQVNHV